jgi:aminoglycoside phosphotransferase (APT) family kinase protein
VVLKFEAITREPGSFQESVTADHVVEMARRAFGHGTEVVSVREMGGGLYNNTYLVRLRDTSPLVLRVAPEHGRQSRVERLLMRNEYASAPYYAGIAGMMPRTLFADWTHEVLARDYMWQELLDGVPALEGLKTYPRSEWLPFYRQLGAITARVHAVRGERFGPVAGPWFTTWSEAVLSVLGNIAADLVNAGLDAADVERLTTRAEDGRAVLNEVVEPRLLHGDLWTANVMLAADAPEPTIVGVLDHDRSSWGDPCADWGLSVVARKSPEAQAAFRETYGPIADGPSAQWRMLVYQGMHIGAVRLERHRLREVAKLPVSYDDMRAVLDRL